MESASRVQFEDDNSPLLDYFYSLDSGHKDFVRSMIQGDSNKILITASEDKTIKLFNITSSTI
jgi:WD40 repeat protein